MNIKTGIAALSITPAGTGGLAACGTGHPTYGPTPGTYYVDCMEAQCTEEPDSGPLGNTCGQVSSDGVQLCS